MSIIEVFVSNDIMYLFVGVIWQKFHKNCTQVIRWLSNQLYDLSHLGVKAPLESKIKAKVTWKIILEVRRSSKTSRSKVDWLGENSLLSKYEELKKEGSFKILEKKQHKIGN